MFFNIEDSSLSFAESKSYNFFIREHFPMNIKNGLAFPNLVAFPKTLFVVAASRSNSLRSEKNINFCLIPNRFINDVTHIFIFLKSVVSPSHVSDY